MSAATISWAWAQKVTPAAGKFVLIALADFADVAHSCRVGKARISRMTELHPSCVAEQMTELERAGLIEIGDRVCLRVGGES